MEILLSEPEPEAPRGVYTVMRGKVAIFLTVSSKQKASEVSILSGTRREVGLKGGGRGWGGGGGGETGNDKHRAGPSKFDSHGARLLPYSAWRAS